MMTTKVELLKVIYAWDKYVEYTLNHFVDTSLIYDFDVFVGNNHELVRRSRILLHHERKSKQ
jgi:hypothetical protein